MAFNLDALLLALHLLAAAAWFGAGWYEKLMIAPAVRQAGPAGVKMLKTFAARGGGAKWFAPASMLTIITGGLLYWRLGIDIATRSGALLSIGAALGLSALLMGIIFHAPAEKRLHAAVAQDDDAAILQHAHHLERHTSMSGYLVTAAFLLMALRHIVI